MSATERSFDEPPPDRLYIDTDFLISCLTDAQPHYPRCISFLEALARHGTEIYVSALTWLEFAYVVSKERFRLELSTEMQAEYALHHWQRREVRGRYIADMIGRARALLAPFEWAQVPITGDVQRRAQDYMIAYGLHPQDAAHVAAAELAGVSDIATLDRGFRKVDDITLWNDLIHTST